MKQIIKIAMMAAAGIFISSGLAAQDGLKVGKSGSFSVKPQLADAVKIDVNPGKEPVTLEKPVVVYETSASLLEAPVYKKKLKAPNISLPVDPLNRLYLKTGFGNYGNIYSEVYYNSLRNRNRSMVIHAKHHSGKGPVDDSKFSENLAEIKGKTIKKTMVYDGGLGFRSDANRFYAIPDTFLFPSTDYKQRFNDLYVHAGLGNDVASEDKFKSHVDLGYYNYGDLYGARENVFSIKAKGVEPFGDNRIIFDGSYDYLGFKAVETQNRSLLKLNVHYQFTANNIRLLAGFNTAQNERFHFYPDVKAEADVAGKFLTIYGLLTGDMHRNTFKSFSRENPWIVSSPQLKNTNEKLTIGGGAKGSLSNSISFLAGLNYKNYNDLYFYLNDTVDARRFQLVYDTATTTLLNFHAEMGMNIMKDFNLQARFDYNKFNVGALDKAYQRPGLELSLLGRYNIGNKLVVGGDLFVLGQRYGKVIGESNFTTLKPIVDLNANISYSFTNLRGLKAYLELQNITGQKYYRWNYYQARGFQITGGIIWSFLDEKYKF